MGNEKTFKFQEKKDFGVTIQDNLSSEGHINKITEETQIKEKMRMAFTSKNEDM